MDTVDHAALRAEIDAARDEWREAYQAVRDLPETDAAFAPRFTAWREASARHDALIEAGALITLGPLGDTDDVPR